MQIWQTAVWNATDCSERCWGIRWGWRSTCRPEHWILERLECSGPWQSPFRNQHKPKQTKPLQTFVNAIPRHWRCPPEYTINLKLSTELLVYKKLSWREEHTCDFSWELEFHSPENATRQALFVAKGHVWGYKMVQDFRCKLCTTSLQTRRRMARERRGV